MEDERRKEKKYVGKFLEDDYDKFQKDFLNLLKDYKRKTQRLDKIIKQSDKQQFQFLLMNEELEEHKKKLENNIANDKLMFQQSRQAQMGEMISMIAHQWRQPLASISGTIVGMQLNQASDKFNLDDKQDRDKFLELQNEKFTRMTDQLKQLSSTIDDFRDFFKSSKIKVLVPITSPIKKAIDMLIIDFEHKGIKITTDFQAEDEISIYSNEIVQVILNILQNSEYNFTKQKIQNPHINISSYHLQNSSIAISITDNGGGIDETILSKIFDPYFSTKDEKNDTGIGLYMSKMIIEEHNNGKIDAKNTDDGVSFIIEFHDL